MAPGCPVCGRVNTSSTGVQFPAESARYIRYCLQLRLDPKQVDKKAYICFEHFAQKDLITEGDKIVGVSRMAVPTKKVAKGMDKPSRMTLDQLLAKNVGLSAATAATTTSHFQSSPALTAMGQATASTSSQPAPEIGIFGFPRSSNQSSVIQRPSSSHQGQGQPRQSTSTTPSDRHLNELAKRTLVFYRKGSQQPIDQQSIREWMRHSFGLSDCAIHHISDTFTVANYHTVFLVLDDPKTLDTCLTTYKSAPEPTSCILSSATDVLREGAELLKVQSDSLAISKQHHLDVSESFRVLLQSPKSVAYDGAPFSDENTWRNLAAAIVPAYQNLYAAATSQLHQQHPSLATTMNSGGGEEGGGASPAGLEGYPTSVQAIMQQIDKITRQNSYPS